MRDVYQLLVKFVRASPTTSDNLQQWSLLHLSMMIGLPYVNDRHIMALCKYAFLFFFKQTTK